MTANDAMVLDLVVDGQKPLLWIPLDLKPQSSTTIKVEYLRVLDSSEISLCRNRPTGIVEDLQPVATAQEVPVE